MSLTSSLKTLNHYANKALETLLGVKEPEKAAAGKTPVVAVTIAGTNQGENVDSVVITTKEEERKPATTEYKERTRTEIQNSIKSKCAKNGIDGVSLIKNLMKHSGMKPGAYEAMSESEKRLLWNGIEQVLDKIIAVKNEYGVSGEVSMEALILETVKQYEEDVKAGNVWTPEETDEMLEASGDINGELNRKGFKKKSKKEQNDLMDENYLEFQRRKEEYINAELAKCPVEKQARLRRRLERRFEYAERMRFSQFVAANDSETSFRGLRLMSPKRMAKGFNLIAESRANETVKQDFMDNVVNVNAEMDLYQSFYNRNERPDGEAVMQMHACAMGGKSETAAVKYNDDYVAARKSGNYQNLERDGIFTQMAAGNLAGAQINQNMSVEKRAELVRSMYRAEQEFGDLDVVVQKANEAVESYLNSHPQERVKLSKEVDEIKKKTEKCLMVALAKSNNVKKHKEAAKNQQKNEPKSNGRTESPHYNETLNYGVQASDKKNTSSPKGFVTTPTGVKSIKPSNNTQKPAAPNGPITVDNLTESSSNSAIELVLASGGVKTIDDIIEKTKKSPKAVYSILCSNNNFVARYKNDVISHIKEQNTVKDLVDIANCSRAFELIKEYNNLDAEDKEELYAQLEKKATSTQKGMFEEKDEQNV